MKQKIVRKVSYLDVYQADKNHSLHNDRCWQDFLLKNAFEKANFVSETIKEKIAVVANMAGLISLLLSVSKWVFDLKKNRFGE